MWYLCNLQLYLFFVLFTLILCWCSFLCYGLINKLKCNYKLFAQLNYQLERKSMKIQSPHLHSNLMEHHRIFLFNIKVVKVLTVRLHLWNLHLLSPHPNKKKKKKRPIVYFPCGVWSVCTTYQQATKIEHTARLFISKHPCKDVWVAFIMLIKPIKMSLVTLSHFSSLRLSSSMHKVLECNLITLLIFDFGRLLMSGRFKSDQGQVRLYDCT